MGGGKVSFETSSVTRKARNGERAGRAAVLVQGRAATGRTLTVSFEGTARVLHGDPAHEANRRLRAEDIKASVLPEPDRAWGRGSGAVATAPRRRAWRRSRR